MGNSEEQSKPPNSRMVGHPSTKCDDGVVSSLVRSRFDHSPRSGCVACRRDIVLCLDRDMAKQELYLFQFASCCVAQPRAGPSQVVRRQLFDGGFRGELTHDVPNNFRENSGYSGPLISLGRDPGGAKPPLGRAAVSWGSVCEPSSAASSTAIR